MGMPTYTPEPKVNLHEVNMKYSSSVDWSSRGAVSPIKDQGQCGSCWAFSTTGALEGLAYVQSNYLWYFAEQQLVDCATWDEYYERGCSGGLMSSAFQYTAAKGICMEADYPYTAKDGTCDKTAEAKARVINDSYSSVMSG